MPPSESGSSQSKGSSSSSGSPGDDWNGVTDPNERRKIQNRIAQRKFRKSAASHHLRRERELTVIQATRPDSNEKLTNARPSTNSEPVGHTAQQGLRNSTKARRRVFRGEASRCATSSSPVDRRTRVRGSHPGMLRRPERVAVRGKTCSHLLLSSSLATLRHVA